MVLSAVARLPLALALLAAGGAAAGAEARTAAAPAPRAYLVRAAEPDGLKLDPPALPDLKPYTPAAVQAMIRIKPAGRVGYARMVEEPALAEFVGGDGRLAEWAARQTSNPRAILLLGGYMTPRDLARALPASQFEQTAPGVYVLRMPLVIKPGATLHVDAATREFRLSEERGAFLVNDGRLFVTDTRLTAWRESENAPARFRRAGEFRPFVNAWGGSRTYIVNSVVTSLGYAASKAYGISLSQYSPSMHPLMRRGRPTGWLLNSEFHDLWYGFYCYEADDVVVLNNVYRDNIVYGIDPHDRSRRLIIAGNKASGTKKKHGIIISREVNDSWIFNNQSFKNEITGIVIDRSSRRNVVAYNDSFDNLGDGVTIYESPDNLLWGNRVVGNGRHGIRLRNSVDIRQYHNVIVGNGLAGIYGHVKDLSGTDRDLAIDPFDPKLSTVVVGGQLIYNGSGPVTLDRPLSAALYDVELLAPRKKNGIQMDGIMGRLQEELLDILVRQRRAAVIEPVDGSRKGS